MIYEVKFNQIGQAHMIYDILKARARSSNDYKPTDVKISKSTIAVSQDGLANLLNTLATKYNARHKLNILA